MYYATVNRVDDVTTQGINDVPLVINAEVDEIEQDLENVDQEGAADAQSASMSDNTAANGVTPLTLAVSNAGTKRSRYDDMSMWLRS